MKLTCAISVLVALSFAVQLRAETPATQPAKSSLEIRAQEEFGRAMALQARFALPLIIGLVAFSSGAIALYFITSNTFTFLQEIFIARKLRNAPLAVQETAD